MGNTDPNGSPEGVTGTSLIPIGCRPNVGVFPLYVELFFGGCAVKDTNVLGMTKEDVERYRLCFETLSQNDLAKEMANAHTIHRTLQSHLPTIPENCLGRKRRYGSSVGR